MRIGKVSAGVCVGVFAAVTAIVAQPIAITPQQEASIYTALAKTAIADPPPASFNASVGMDVPAAVALYPIPRDVAVAAIERYLYTVLYDEVILVDPATRKIVLVMTQPH
jgi:Protein of unknown function (DUF1236)